MQRVKEAQTKLEIFHTPAPYSGAYRPFKATLGTKLQQMVSYETRAYST